MSSSVSATSTTSSVDYSNILQAATGASTIGIDVTAAVQAAVTAARAPENVWKDEQTTLTSQQTELTSIQSATQNLSNDLQSLNNLIGPLASRTVSSSNSSAVTATAASGTAAGTHTVVVNSLAQTAAWYSDLSTAANTTLPSTSFTITTASGSSATINTGSGVNTLNDLVKAVNNATDASGNSLGLKASIISDATGSRLAIVSPSSGSAADFSVSTTNFSGTSWKSQELPAGSTLGADTLTVTVGGTSTDFSIASGDSYSTLATKINNAGIGVTASVVTDANGTKLQLASSDGTTAFGLNEPSFGFTQASKGANASVVVDGVPVTSASNQVTNAIGGVTLNLLGTGYGVTTTLTVGADTSSISTAINKFVSDYNTAVTTVNSQFALSSTTGKQGDLSADATVRQLQSTLQAALNYTYKPSSGTTTVSSLFDLGISVQTDGTLSLDSTTFNAAITNNTADVQNFFEGPSLNGFAASMDSSLNTYLAPSNGAFTLDLQSMKTTYSNLADEINNFETNYIASLQTTLTNDLAQAESALQELPTKMAQLNAMLGLTGSKN